VQKDRFVFFKNLENNGTCTGFPHDGTCKSMHDVEMRCFGRCALVNTQIYAKRQIFVFSITSKTQAPAYVLPIDASRGASLSPNSSAKLGTKTNIYIYIYIKKYININKYKATPGHEATPRLKSKTPTPT
jgi:hypothetical protein